MFRCLDCNCLFQYPVRYTEQRCDYYYETWYGCPKCAGAYREEEEFDPFNEPDTEERQGTGSGVYFYSRVPNQITGCVGFKRTGSTDEE